MTQIIKRIALLTSFVALTMIAAVAQPPGGGPGRGRGPGGFDPSEMIEREKAFLYKEISDLTEDQKTLLDGIFEEFASSMTELREEAREIRDPEVMRPKMEALHTEKDELIKDVLNESQYMIYEEHIQTRKERRNQHRDQRHGSNFDGN